MKKTLALLTAPLLLTLLTGCGSDKPYDGSYQGPQQPEEAQGVAPEDPLAVSSGSGIADGTPPPSLPDPLLKGSNHVTGLNLTPRDPLIGNSSLMGRTMPTAHSHWLRGRLQDSHVMVELNGIRHGRFSGILDQDITMKLQPGVNMVTFHYMPNSSHSSVNLEIVESEHDPPIAPLVTFRSSILSKSDGSAAQPVTKTFMFVAK